MEEVQWVIENLIQNLGSDFFKIRYYSALQLANICFKLNKEMCQEVVSHLISLQNDLSFQLIQGVSFAIAEMSYLGLLLDK